MASVPLNYTQIINKIISPIISNIWMVEMQISFQIYLSWLAITLN